MQLENDQIYNSTEQRIAKKIHNYKAKLKRKERKRVQWLSQYFSAGATILDIGAHFGYFAKEFARLYNNSCSIYAFEHYPITWTYSTL